MTDAPAINQVSRSDAPLALSHATELTTPLDALHNQSPGHTQGNARDPLSLGGGDLRRGSEESFPLAIPTLSTAQARPALVSGEELATTTARPMAPTAVLDQVGLSLESMQPRGNSRVDLHVLLEGGGQVRIELQMRDGAVHASFLTESTELRDALQQGWSGLANRSESLGMSLSAPVFKSPSAVAANTGQQDFRERHQEPPQEQNPSLISYSPPHQPKHAGQSNRPSRTAATGLNAWA